MFNQPIIDDEEEKIDDSLSSPLLPYDNDNNRSTRCEGDDGTSSSQQRQLRRRVGGTTTTHCRQQQQQIINGNDRNTFNRNGNTPESQDQQQNHHHHSRLLDRDGAFYQSSGKWKIQRLSQRIAYRKLATKKQRCIRLWQDWFHSLSYKPTIVLLLIIFVAYTGAVIFFAIIYRIVNIIGAKEYSTGDDGTDTKTSFCGMDITNKMEALYFSLSTMTTIGYGVSDYYFGDCWTPLLLVLWQVCTALTFDAVAIGLIFTRISRGQKRGKTIIFSNKAVIRRVNHNNQYYFMFRIGELRRQHIIEAKVRVYCLRHERYPLPNDNHNRNTNTNGVDNNNLQDRNGSNEATTSTSTTVTTRRPQIETHHFITKQVKLCFPDEANVGAQILMNVPQVIVHKIDTSSPLIPPKPFWYDADGNQHNNDFSRNSSSSSSSRSSDIVHDDEQRRRQEEKDSIHRFMKDREIEIVVIVEGTDDVTGSALQARHSYCCDDIVWDHDFVSCIYPWNNASSGGEAEEDVDDDDDDDISSNDYEDDDMIDENDVSANETFLEEYDDNNNNNIQDEGQQQRQRQRPRRQRRRRRNWLQNCNCRRRTHGMHSKACCVDYAKFHFIKPVPLNCDLPCPYIPQQQE